MFYFGVVNYVDCPFAEILNFGDFVGIGIRFCFVFRR